MKSSPAIDGLQETIYANSSLKALHTDDIIEHHNKESYTRTHRLFPCSAIGSSPNIRHVGGAMRVIFPHRLWAYPLS